jgi:hypothetical protein
LTVSVDGGNITTDGGGTITDNKINDALGGTASVGYSALDLKWTSTGNNKIITSDRLQPAGWAFYDDGDTVTQTAPALQANAVKFSVDGLGSNTDETHEPKVIRGISSLWDVATDDILPVTSGDSYMLRIAFTLTAKSGNPSFMTVALDIGATGAITIPIAQLSVVTPNSFPRNVMLPIPIFTLDTFLANGGQIFMYTDAGSIDIEERSIFIERISSGAS